MQETADKQTAFSAAFMARRKLTQKLQLAGIWMDEKSFAATPFSGRLQLLYANCISEFQDGMRLNQVEFKRL
jgi:hypothetical protein